MNTNLKVHITQNELKELIFYNHDTGIFTWKERSVEKFLHSNNPEQYCATWNTKYSNTDSGNLHKSGYIVIRVYGKDYKAHRLAWLYMEGYFPENQIDHINRIKSDNRWCNLREISTQCNIRNRGITKKNTSGVVGVYWNKRVNKWSAQITINKKPINLGYYMNFVDAVKIRWDAEVKYKFPNCNFSSSAFKYLKECDII